MKKLTFTAILASRKGKCVCVCVCTYAYVCVCMCVFVYVYVYVIWVVQPWFHAQSGTGKKNMYVGMLMKYLYRFPYQKAICSSTKNQ